MAINFNYDTADGEQINDVSIDGGPTPGDAMVQLLPGTYQYSYVVVNLDTNETATIDGGTLTVPSCEEPVEPTPTPTPSESGSALSGTVSPGIVAPNGTLTVTAAGFEANESIEIWLHSTPVLLHSGTTSADGTVSQTVTIPTDTVIDAHQIEIRGATSGSVFLNLTVVEPTAVDTLAATGLNDGSVWMLGGAGALLVTLGVLLYRRTRTTV
ncbi:MAG: hypothetical protein QM568_06955 [Microbacterium sp.]